MRYTLAAVALLTSAGVARTQPDAAPNANQAAAAASRFAAIKAACPEAVPTDKVRADRYVDMYGDVGTKMVGVNRFARLVKDQTAQRIREIQVTGLQRWCEDQRRYLREMGETKVFP